MLELAVETTPAERIRQVQEDRVIELTRLAQERSAFYRETFDAAGITVGEITSLDDFQARVPFMNKDSIREYRDRTGDSYGGLLTVDPSEVTSVTASSGTTGDPTFFVERWGDEPVSPLNARYIRPLWDLGVRPGDNVLCSAASFRGYIEGATRALGAVPILVDTWMGNWAEVAEAIRRHRPTYCQLMSMNLVELERLQHQGEDLRELMSCFVSVGFAGEPLGARMREKLTREWGLNLWVYTSAGDTGLAWECAEHDGYHLNWDETLTEVLDADGNPVPDGEVGELVVTAMDNDTYPLIRYRTDDLVRLTRQPCPCGRTSPRMWVLGRAGDETVVAGRAVLPHEVWSIVEQQDETETGLFQIIRPQREVERLRVRVGYDDSAEVDLDDLVRRLTAGLSTTLGISAELIDILPETAGQLLRRGSAAKVPRVAKS
ncbi:phenylacetate--CoA ligase family protein [Frankia canadensis]|uniref:phenylacetate--CoA ligase family protein n=1 Tax=Frankia canadensis TaxID=1836972 RepID=UPI000C7E75D8|nr:phenylacetate--CoA ligase family protein [Frankia canadensis]